MTISYRSIATGIRGDLAFILLVSLVTRFRAVLLLPVLFGGVGAAAYGQWAVCSSLAAILANLAHGNLHTALLRRYQAEEHRRRAFVWATIGGGVAGAAIMSLAVLVLSEWIAGSLAFGQEQTSLVRATAALIFSHVLVDLTTNYYRARGNVRLFTVLDAVPTLAEIGFVVLGVQLGWSLASAFWLVVGFELLLAGACSVPLVREHPFISPALSDLRELLAFSAPTIPFSFGDSLLAQADRMVIAAFVGASQAGTYAAAYSLSFLPLIVVRPLQVVLLVRLAPLWDAGERHRATASLRLALKAYLALAIPIAIGIAFVGPVCLQFFTGATQEEWTVGLILSLGLGNALCGACYVSVHSLYLLKQTKTAGAVFALGGVLNLVANLLIVPFFGLMGSALVTLVVYGLMLAAFVLIPRQEISVPVGIPTLAKLAACSTALVTWLASVGASTPPRVFVSICGGAVVYLTALMAFRMFDKSEQQTLSGGHSQASIAG